MTLATYVRVLSPRITPRAFFDFQRQLIGATDDFTWKKASGDYSMDLGQGLSALMCVTYGLDGPMPEHLEYCDDEERARPQGCSCGPQGFMEVCWDTAYGYRAANGARCEDLHAYFIKATGDWLDARSAPWAWMTDTYCEWHMTWGGNRQVGDATKGAPDLPVVRELLRLG